MSDQGRVVIFTGEGKGKTVAALGTALRAVGHGMRTLVIQFVKAERCGEHAAAEHLGGMLEVRLAGTGFVEAEQSESRQDAAAKAREALDQAREALGGGEYGLVVLDEVLFALAEGLLETDELRAAVEGRASGIHVVLTGAGPYECLADLADTVTEMRCIKHAFQRATPATPGIEY